MNDDNIFDLTKSEITHIEYKGFDMCIYFSTGEKILVNNYAQFLMYKFLNRKELQTKIERFFMSSDRKLIDKEVDLIVEKFNEKIHELNVFEDVFNEVMSEVNKND